MFPTVLRCPRQQRGLARVCAWELEGLAALKLRDDPLKLRGHPRRRQRWGRSSQPQTPAVTLHPKYPPTRTGGGERVSCVVSAMLPEEKYGSAAMEEGPVDLERNASSIDQRRRVSVLPRRVGKASRLLVHG